MNILYKYSDRVWAVLSKNRQYAILYIDQIPQKQITTVAVLTTTPIEDLRRRAYYAIKDQVKRGKTQNRWVLDVLFQEST